MRTAFLILLALASCQGLSRNQEPTKPAGSADGYLRGGLAAGSAEISDDFDTFDGASFAGRIEVGAAMTAKRALELGLRLGLGVTDVSYSDSFVSADIQTTDVTFEPVVRWVIPTEGQVRPYLEAFVGLQDSSGDITGSIPSLGIGRARASYDADGTTYGLGGGLRIAVDDQGAHLMVGLELRNSDTDATAGFVNVPDVDEDRVLFTILFGSTF